MLLQQHELTWRVIEISQSQKDTYCMICMYILHDFTYMYNLKNNTNEQTHQKRDRVVDT